MELQQKRFHPNGFKGAHTLGDLSRRADQSGRSPAVRAQGLGFIRARFDHHDIFVVAAQFVLPQRDQTLKFGPGFALGVTTNHKRRHAKAGLSAVFRGQPSNVADDVRDVFERPAVDQKNVGHFRPQPTAGL